MTSNDFFPDAVTIHVGDTVHFTSTYPEIHTVSFLPTGMAFPALVVPGPSGPPQFGFNPVASTPTYTGTATTLDSTKLLNSGILNKGDFVDVTFPHTGTFHFVCIVHGPTMSVDVTVVAAATGADSQSAIDTRAASQEQALVSKGQTAAAAIQPSPASTKLPDGSTEWNNVIGGETAEAALDQFFPANLTVTRGRHRHMDEPAAGCPAHSYVRERSTTTAARHARRTDERSTVHSVHPATLLAHHSEDVRRDRLRELGIPAARHAGGDVLVEAHNTGNIYLCLCDSRRPRHEGTITVLAAGGLTFFPTDAADRRGCAEYRDRAEPGWSSATPWPDARRRPRVRGSDL